MAFDQTLKFISGTAAASFAATQFQCCVFGAAGTLALQTTLGGAVDGILQNKPSAGQVAQIAISGVTKAQVGTAGCAAGDSLMVDASGNVTTATGSNTVIGRALSAGTSGQIISILLKLGE